MTNFKKAAILLGAAYVALFGIISIGSVTAAIVICGIIGVLAAAGTGIFFFAEHMDER